MSDTVLVYVDDEKDLCGLIADLYGDDHNMKTFTNSCEALEFLNSTSSVKLVLSDYRMPEMTGVELSEKIERDDLAFYLMTGELEVDLSDYPRISGVLAKPVDFAKLSDLFEKYL